MGFSWLGSTTPGVACDHAMFYAGLGGQEVASRREIWILQGLKDKKHLPFWQMNTVFLLVRRDDGLTRLMSLENPPFIDGFPIKAIKASIYRGLAIAMFDYRMVRVRGKLVHGSEGIQNQ